MVTQMPLEERSSAFAATYCDPFPSNEQMVLMNAGEDLKAS